MFTSLILQSSGASGPLPYVATLMPTAGQVPAGNTLESPDDGSMQATVLSTWPDGSAAVVVVAGRIEMAAGESRTLRVQGKTGGIAGSPLAAEQVARIVNSVSVDFGDLGKASVSDLTLPERIWWANGQTICARYRAAATGHASLEAVVDVQAFSDGRALVEVVVENAKFDAAASKASTSLAAAAYTTATVAVNGNTVASVSGTANPAGSHAAHRAWYVKAWVGGDPGVRAQQAHADLQKHPLLFKCDQAATSNLAGYAADAYTPWSTGRHRATNMGGTGDHPSIGPIPQWEARALQSGDARAWAATEASCLAMLSYNINHRDVSGAVPYSAIMPQKCQGSFWRNWPRNTAEPAFEGAHQPASGLMAFVARPSPVYIEIAQKIAVWAGTNDSTRDHFAYVNEAAAGITDFTGIVGESQVRTKAWGPRNILHATWLSPSAHPWRAGGVEWLDRNVRYLGAYAGEARTSLVAFYEGFPSLPTDMEGAMPGFQMSTWMYHFAVPEWHKIAASKLLQSLSAARQTAVDALADLMAQACVKWVNEQPNGGWRFLPYRQRIGDNSGLMSAFSSWTAQRANDLSGAPSAVNGLWHGGAVGHETTWAQVEAIKATETSAGVGYPTNFWTALVAAVERGVPGSLQAWETVNLGITNLSTWRRGFGNDPRHGAHPRNL